MIFDISSEAYSELQRALEDKEAKNRSRKCTVILANQITMAFSIVDKFNQLAVTESEFKKQSPTDCMMIFEDGRRMIVSEKGDVLMTCLEKGEET